jgi:hypothetical protein
MMRTADIQRSGPRLLLVLGAALLLAACVPATRIKPVESAAQVPAGQTLLVGRIELDPPLAPGEQKLSERYAEFDRVALVILGEEPREMERLSLGDLSQRINAPLGKHFFVAHPSEPFYILKSWVVMYARIEVQSGRSAMPTDTNAPLHGMFRVDVRPGDQAVYIGTIRYHRDEFFSTTRVVVRDDYAAAQAEFQRRFKGMNLRKSLAQPVRSAAR